MEVRPAEAADSRVVYALICSLEADAPPWEAFTQTYAHNLAQSLIQYLVAEEEGAVRGFVSLHMDRQLHHASLVGEIQELIVDEAYRSRGIGGTLLRTAQRRAREAGCSHLELNSGFARARAHAFYERHGWVKDHYNLTYKRLREEK